MDDLRRRLLDFVRPLYQDLDGISRLDDVERIAKLARSFYRPSTDAESRAFEILILFHGLGKWLKRVGSASRAVLTVPGITELDLRAASASVARLDDPKSDAERAVAAAVLIDGAGVRGLAQRFAAARREGHSLIEVVREAMSDLSYPQWLPSAARDLLEQRFAARRRVCADLLDEM